MGNFCISSDDPGRAQSQSIDEELKKYKSQLQKEKKILLLGSAPLLLLALLVYNLFTRARREREEHRV